MSITEYVSLFALSFSLLLLLFPFFSPPNRSRSIRRILWGGPGEKALIDVSSPLVSIAYLVTSRCLKGD